MRIIPQALTLGVTLAVFAQGQEAMAHVVCGNRVFPATLTMDDPGVGDELSLPTVTYIPTPSGQTTDFAYEWDKTITQDLAFDINGDYLTQRGSTQDLNGWNNITLTLKDELPCIEDHEFAWSVGVVGVVARTGSAQLRSAGAIADVGSVAPTFYVGKGMGDLPIGYLRPLAITGEVSRQFSAAPSVSPNSWLYAGSLQYSVPYLQQHVKALPLPDFVSRLVPIVEVAMTSPSTGATTGTIAPGLLYEADTWQVGVEALVPANSATRQVQGTGFIFQFHLFLDDLAGNTPLGRPLIDKDLWQW